MPNLRLGRRSIPTRTTSSPNKSSDLNLLLRNLRSQRACKVKESSLTVKVLNLEEEEAVSKAGAASAVEVAEVVSEAEAADVVVEDPHEEALEDEAEGVAAINNK